MPRRLLVAILLLSYLAGQVAAMPHAHESPPPGHHHRSHVHVGWLLDWLGAAEHGHSHDKCPSHHDEDSIDVPTFVATVDRAAGSADPPQGFVDLLAVACAGCESNSLETPIQTCCHAPGETPGSGCALYLTLRTLRI